MRFGMSRSHRVMMRERVQRESVVGNVCWTVVRRLVLFNWLVREPRCAVSLSRRATLVRHTLSGAQINRIALALEPCYRPPIRVARPTRAPPGREPCYRPRIGVAGPNVQLLTVLTGLVGVEQAEVLIEAFVDRRRGSPAATGREDEKAKRETTH